MYRLLFVFIFSSFGIFSFSQTKKVITHEDMWMMKRVGAPQVSPDGRWVVFTVTEPAYDEKEAVNDLWIAAADGTGKPRRFTTNKSGESSYQWNPDGKRLAFVAKREGDENAQIYIISMSEAGGEAQRFTSLSTGASQPRWSPDGKSIMFTSRVFPGAFTDSANKKESEERKKTKYKARVYTSFPIRNWDQWIDEKQTHLFVQSTDSSNAKDIFSEEKMVKSEGFQFGDASWLNDSREIIYSASIDATTGAYQEPTFNLYKISANGGMATKLTSDGDSYNSVMPGEDGKYIFCLSNNNNNYKVYALNRLTRFDWPSLQNKTIMAPDLDRPINSFNVTNDNILFSAEDAGFDRIYIIPPTGGAARLLTSTVGCYNNISSSDDGRVIVSNYEDACRPAELVRINSNEKTYAFLTSFNDDKIKSLDLAAPQSIWFTSSRGKKIRSFIIRPAGFDSTRKYPLFVVIHGGPAGAWKDNWGYRWNYHLLASPGYVLLLTDYTGSTGYGEKFGQDIQYDPLKGPAEEINEAAKDAIKRFAFIDGSLQAAGGASYGGHLSNWLQATTTHYKCLISHAGMINSETQWGSSDNIYNREVMNGGPPWMQTKTWKEQNAIRLAKNFKTPTLVTVGEQDFRVPLNNSIEYWSVLQRMKIPSKLIVFPEENHWILKGENSRFFYNEVHAWLKTYLK